MKAILVINNPATCSECKISHADIDGYYCPYEPVLIPNEIAMSKRMDWCPLKTIKKKEDVGIRYHDLDNIPEDIEINLRKQGYNWCVEEILGDYITQEEADCCGVQFWHDD